MNPGVVPVAGQPLLLLSGFDLAPFGYTTSEFFISGVASSYKLSGAAGPDGRWDAVTAETAPYTTRIVVARPSDANRFNGTVIVEWLNVSAGTDSAPGWNMVHREILRGGYGYVGVSAQSVGIEGGSSLVAMGAPLKKADPQRYGSLRHPGDAFSYDMFSQAGRVVRASDFKILGELAPKRLIALGESQSAVFLTTYVNAVDPLAKVYDGFLIHSRFGRATSIEDPSMFKATGQAPVARLRTDLRAPVITAITETDLVDGNIPGFHGARQPDNDRLRIWEIAGTSHADAYSFTIGFMDSGSAPLDILAKGYAPTANILGSDLAKPINNAPQHHYVVEAALSNLDRWIRTGQAPSAAAPIKLNEGAERGPSSFVLDANGLAEGGVRTPWVDVPTARLSGLGNSGGPLGFMVGVCEPFGADTLDRIYPGGKSEYLRKFEAALDSAIRAGFILAADRQEILELAAMTYPGSR
ncbi:MAG TPA: alpha/beta hydrolase domain-containing protein [Candidatus Acidoferrales bacterium]|nr:alpha/beta hydrolase domain-containing protein [Candidatus Acidoferrales bacterium]